jgi:hypothetical protein
MANQPFPSVPSVDDMLSNIDDNVQRMGEDEEYYKSLVDPHPSGNPISIGRRIPSPETLAARQIKGVKDNKEKWLEGVTHPKKNFKEEALKQKSRDRYKDSMEKVLSEDRWAGGMENVNESEAIATVERLGADHYAKAVEAREAKILRVAKELDSDRLALASHIDGMDSATDADREAKMIANKRGLQAIGKRRRGGV